MGLLDTIKKALRGKNDEVSDGIDKAADVVDDKTGGQHTDTIDDVAEKAKDVVDDLGDTQ
jgi:ABC-type transporter Mla subunit MlaD